MILTDERFKKTKLICNENYERMRGMQMEVAGFLALGILVGLLGALLGIGGGMVIVPLLVFAWDYEPQLAIGTSVLMVLMNAVSGTWVGVYQAEEGLRRCGLEICRGYHSRCIFRQLCRRISAGQAFLSGVRRFLCAGSDKYVSQGQ